MPLLQRDAYISPTVNSGSTAHREVMPSVVHYTDPYGNHRAEVSHEPTRQRERPIRRFQSPGQTQRFLPVHGLVKTSSALDGICCKRVITESFEVARSLLGRQQRGRHDSNGDVMPTAPDCSRNVNLTVPGRPLSLLLGALRRCCTARNKSLTSLMPVAESPGAVRIGHPERGHLVEYLAPNSVFNSLPRQRSCSHLRPDDRFVTIDRVLHHASLGEA